MKDPIKFYVGGYTHAGEDGILKCSFDGRHVAIQAANRDLENPSWILAHPARPLLYAVEELSPKGRLAVLEDQGEHLKLIASMSTYGADPCHIAVTPDLRHPSVWCNTPLESAIPIRDLKKIPPRRGRRGRRIGCHRARGKRRARCHCQVGKQALA